MTSIQSSRGFGHLIMDNKPWEILRGDVLEVIPKQPEESFDALICDPPYHLQSIVDRYGRPDAAPPKGKLFGRMSSGFLGQTWDGGDIAFNPETWKVILSALKPGALGMVFGGARTSHRVAVAIEDAGAIIHPSIYWVYSSGFPKGKAIKDRDDFDGYRYGAQSIKPGAEPIIVFQKPHLTATQREGILENYVGVYDIEGSRISAELEHAKNWDRPAGFKGGYFEQTEDLTKAEKQEYKPSGRWPSNFILSHLEACKQIGIGQDSLSLNTWDSGMNPFGGTSGDEPFSEEHVSVNVPIWDCSPGCPVKALSRIDNADRYYYQSKVSPHERDAGLEGFPNVGTDERPRYNPHPTLKPIDLIKHLAGLLLPPAREGYDRGILVPFSGVGSEMIGSLLAGWDHVTGIELDQDRKYIPVANARLEYWIGGGYQTPLPIEDLEAYGKTLEPSKSRSGLPGAVRSLSLRVVRVGKAVLGGGSSGGGGAR